MSCLEGTEAEILAMANRHATGGDWTEGLRTAADLVLTPAACYPVYPIAASRGPVPKGGYRFDVACDCFRREPSRYLDRLQSFRMREYVTIGAPEEVAAFRERWVVRAKALADELGLHYRVEQASDPFFGRVGAVKAISQLEQALKFELLVPLRGENSGTACMSFNYHRDHFGTTWDIRLPDGSPAHTGCVAFGMDRLAVACSPPTGRRSANGRPRCAPPCRSSTGTRPAFRRTGKQRWRLTLTCSGSSAWSPSEAPLPQRGDASPGPAPAGPAGRSDPVAVERRGLSLDLPAGPADARLYRPQDCEPQGPGSSSSMAADWWRATSRRTM